ncbi:hypothetical protein [uncultured Sphingomonas sp.]|uniref:hypothetical protein n=1 Tax=uncultured Sphingomonas sp. TaxID=158754 RepID=UPI00263208AB|nr:hypothetical protein [uncultured Sphingomonas sp.]
MTLFLERPRWETRVCVDGTDKGFTLNGPPTMFRGALDCSLYPLTGDPPTDLDRWRRVIRRISTSSPTACGRTGCGTSRPSSSTPPAASR